MRHSWGSCCKAGGYERLAIGAAKRAGSFPSWKPLYFQTAFSRLNRMRNSPGTQLAIRDHPCLGAVRSVEGGVLRRTRLFAAIFPQIDMCLRSKQELTADCAIPSKMDVNGALTTPSTIRHLTCTLDVRVDGLKMMILLVEDSRFLRVASERALVKAGYDVISVVDGEAALLMAREHIPNLILLDMMLPKLDGLGVLRSLKHDSQTADIPVIVLSGLGQQNEAKLKKEGAAAYFTKSDSLLENNSQTLLRVVESILGKQETTRSVDAISASVS